MSLIIGTIGVLVGIFFYRINKFAGIGIAYFSLMEIIQYFQYSVIDKCDDPLNKFLTQLGYVHICFQPLFFNLWLFAFMKNPPFIFLYLSIAAGFLLLSRLFYVTDDTLCDTKNEALCGVKTCSFSGNTHVAWNLRLKTPGSYYFTPSIALHFFMFFIPTLVTFQITPILAMIFAGPWLSLFITDNIHEQPAIWCYTAVAQTIITFILLGKK